MQACDDERTAHWLWRMPHPYTLDDGVDYIESRTEQLATAAGITWAVVDPTSDELLGAISAFGIKPEREAELGYWTHPEARGRGVMTEALQILRRMGQPPDHPVSIHHPEGDYLKSFLLRAA